MLAFVLGMAVLTWTATGLAGLFAHGSWPDGVSFARTPTAISALLHEPHDMAAAWPETPARQLSGYGLFWGILISQLMVLIVLTVFVLGTLARWRAVRQAAREEAEAAEVLPPGPEGHGYGYERHPGYGPGPYGGPAAYGQQGPPPPATDAYPDPYAGDAHPAAPTAPYTPPRAPRTAPAAEEAVAAPAAAPEAVPDDVPGAAPDAEQDGGAPTAVLPTVTAPRPAAPDGLLVAPSAEAAVRAVCEAEGAVLVVTGDPALYEDTVGSRTGIGPAHVFDPAQLTTAATRLRWAPHRDCEDMPTARTRAAALLAPVRSPARADAAVHDAAETLLRCWLHAAAVAGEPFRQVHRWALSGSSKDAVRILRTKTGATSGSAGELEATLTAHAERREAATDLVRLALNSLSQLHIRNACTPSRADRIAWDSFIAETGTLYVVGQPLEAPHRGDPAAMPLVTALASAVVEHGRRTAERSPAGRLDPPLTVVLDHPATVAPLPELTSLLADGAASGVRTVALVRSEEQLRTWWPEILRGR
ncbi:type VI secretion protein [Streptomyces sp. NPDC054784]